MSPFFRGYLPSAPPSPGGTARACCLLMPHASPFGIKPRELGVGVVDPVALGPHHFGGGDVFGIGAVNLAGAQRDRGVQGLGGLGVGGIGQAAAISPVTSFQTANRRVISVR
jgi:hypothetical protein